MKIEIQLMRFVLCTTHSLDPVGFIPFDSNTLVNNVFERAEPRIQHQDLSLVKRTRLIKIAKPLTSRFLRKTLLYEINVARDHQNAPPSFN